MLIYKRKNDRRKQNDEHRKQILHDLEVAKRKKELSRTHRADRDAGAIELPLIDILPAAPDWLPNAHAMNEWHRLTAILHANRLLTEGGLSALGQLCALHGKLVQSYYAGATPNAAMIAQLRGFLNDFGLTPVAQNKVGTINKAHQQSNPFAALSSANVTKI